MTNSTPTHRTNSDGTKEWRLSGKLHRTDGPALEYVDGRKEWYVNGEYHRIDGAAVELADGTKYWYVEGKLHRTDGPAVEHADGYKEWWVDGNKISIPYSHVLTAAFNRGLPIREEVLSDILKGMSQTQKGLAQNVQLNNLKSIIHKHWPTHVKKILVTLFMDTDPTIKHLAFSLLGLQTKQKGISGVTFL